jgi:hypothetical protein
MGEDNEDYEQDNSLEGQNPIEGQDPIEQEGTSTQEPELSTEDYDRLSTLLEKPEEELTDEDRSFMEANSDFIEEEVSLQQSLQAILDYEDDEQTINEGSPEEIASFIIKRDSKVKQRARIDAYQELRDRDPELYNAIDYVLRGGKSRDFYNSAQAIDTQEIKDEQIAKSVLKSFYTAKGISEPVINNIINGFGTEDDLIKHAKEISVAEIKQKEAEQYEIIRQQKENQERLNNYADQITNTLNEKITKGEIGEFIIPLEKRKEFDKYIRSKTNVYPNGELSVTTRFPREQLDGVLQAEWFRFVNGDLNKLIKRKAASLNAQGLKKRMRTERPKSGVSGKPGFTLRELSNT